ncbi:CLUMA_CG005250, isoform A [Clunio marinus]|uniref:CLUMA_CG005250, isoform A n=1 Tax=Clunio marinus TaxID=568069 RepID=A0A1J1HW62_9DIPT|nr:CLUMA_CG005250, isoform A [Clunio marinus]
MAEMIIQKQFGLPKQHLARLSVH